MKAAHFLQEEAPEAVGEATAIRSQGTGRSDRASRVIRLSKRSVVRECRGPRCTDARPESRQPGGSDCESRWTGSSW